MQWGFTLPELLAALAILGVIATFTIPKVLNASQSREWKATTKEAVSMVVGAYNAYRINNTVDPDVLTVGDITPYMNYIRIDTSSDVDHYYGHASPVRSCGNPSQMCIVMHNGAVIRIGTSTGIFFCASDARARWFQVDPDGKVTDAVPTATGNGKAISFTLYENGRVTTSGDRINPTCGSAPPVNSQPPWFTW